MAQYKIESPLVDGHEVGDTVNETAFAEGVNIDALVEGGFISVVGSKSKTEAKAPVEETKE